MDSSTEASTTMEDRASLGSLIAAMLRDLVRLLRQELDLAGVELVQNVRRARRGAWTLGVATGVALVALVMLALAATLGLALILSLWMPPAAAAFVGALAVGLPLGAGAVLLFRRGLEEFKDGSFVPERTLESLKENAEWMKRQLQ
ncbi:MAG TPA: phage holin family protein [Planctomycetota bacterium]|nr:phage holin family protein [Planctomycetota bacterium]